MEVDRAKLIDGTCSGRGPKCLRRGLVLDDVSVRIPAARAISEGPDSQGHGDVGLAMFVVLSNVCKLSAITPYGILRYRIGV